MNASLWLARVGGNFFQGVFETDRMSVPGTITPHRAAVDTFDDFDRDLMMCQKKGRITTEK
jgi:hypothetical protein